MSLDGNGRPTLDNPICIDLDLNLDSYMTIPVYDNTKEDMEKRKKFNRAKEKREFQKLVDEALYADYEDER